MEKIIIKTNKTELYEVLNKINDFIVNNRGTYTVYRAMTCGEHFQLDDQTEVVIKQTVAKRAYKGLYKIKDGVQIRVVNGAEVANNFVNSATETKSWLYHILELDDEFEYKSIGASKTADELYDCSDLIEGLDDTNIFEQVTRLLEIRDYWQKWYKYVSNRLGCVITFDDGFQPMWYGALMDCQLIRNYTYDANDEFENVLQNMGLDDMLLEDLNRGIKNYMNVA